jgi:hypothetical protein
MRLPFCFDVSLNDDRAPFDEIFRPLANHW